MEKEYLGTATYSPEDNKLRMYPFNRLDTENYDKLKNNGFKWAPKQELFVAGKWTPKREDILLDMCGSIDDEDMTPEERSADRAERFAMYRDKRRSEAGTFADNFDNGPAVHGYQSQQRAERVAKRHDRQRVKAFTQWDKAEYWQTRTKGVIGHALFKNRSDVRRGRILSIEKDQRALEREVKEALTIWDAWEKVRDEKDPEQKAKLAQYVSGIGFQSWSYIHPRNPENKTSLYYLLKDEKDPITPDEAVELFFHNRQRPGSEGGYSDRLRKHYELRLAYERQMIEADGGSASNVEMVPGGFIGKYQIHKVSKSPATKKVVSVSVMAPAGTFDYWTRNKAGECLQKINIQRCGEHIYTPPTPEELKAFNAMIAENKKLAKEKNAGAPKLINPDAESAQRLQDLWNSKSKKIYDEYRAGRSWVTEEYQPTQVREMTQAQYSQRSKGTYSYYKTVSLKTDGFVKSGRLADKDFTTSCKVRQCPASASFTHQADCVIVITDKPRKPLPQFAPIVSEQVKEGVAV